MKKSIIAKNILLGAGFLLAPSMVWAQSAPAGDAQQQSEEDDIQDENLVVVTGSQIKGAKIDDVLPVTVVNEEYIEASGASSGDELFRSIPQAGSVAFNEQNTTGGINSARGDVASINLRDLGTGNTLMLINGRRMVLNPGFQTELLVPVVSPDTNTIPPGGIRRVEVLRDGASALYGADAVAGVVNTILKDKLDGGYVRSDYRMSDGTGLYSISVQGGMGFDFNQGRSNFTLYGYYFHENGMPASSRRYSRDSDRRSLLVGTKFEGDSQFDNSSTNSPYGSFEIQGASATSSNTTALRDDDFHIQPCSNFGDSGVPSDGRYLKLNNGLCADNGTTIDDDLQYNIDGDRDLYSAKNRYNVYALFSHEFSPSAEFYFEGSYYRSKSSQDRESSALLSAVPIGILNTAYYNPLGKATLPDGSPNPNRITQGVGRNVGAEGRNLILERYRLIDAGARRGSVDKDTYRLVAGLRGNFGNWDYDAGLLYSQANTLDLTKDRISNTALEAAINRTDATAYNPFNGGCLNSDTSRADLGDCTPSNASALDAIRIDVFRKGETTLALADFKISNSKLFSLPGGDVGIAAGVEFRRETFKDDRDPRLDGTITYTNIVTGEFFGSDVLGSSPSPDTSGNREVYSAYAETFIPLVSEDMNIPLIRSINVQLAGRFEDFSDVGSTFVPRAGASWELFNGFMLRGAWSEGFRAPNLVQVNDAGTTRVNTRDDYTRCQAQIEKGIIANFGECVGLGTVSLRTGTNLLRPEETESINLGAVFSPQFIPGLTFTVDYWRVRQDGIVGVFGDDNALALDLLRRLNGSTNPNVIRRDPDQDQLDLYAGTSLAPAGDVLQVLDPYLNLDSRVSKGWDFGMVYDVGQTPIGELDIQVNAAHLVSFFQSPGEDGQELLDAVASGALPNDIVISDIGEQMGINGRPNWRFSGSANLRTGQFNFSAFGQYISSVLNNSVTQDQTGEFWRVDDWFKLNLAVSYTIDSNTAIDGTRLRFGVNNVFNSAPPLADESYGYLSSLHDARGRQFTFQIQKKF